jgi:hypothetical protein
VAGKALVCGAVLAVLAAAGLGSRTTADAEEDAEAGPSCPPPARALRYPDVEPIFATHCAGCHDARKGKNPAAQRVFEMTTYPFSTARPRTLLADLRGMFIGRGNLSRDEKCAGLSWIAGGGRDARGRPPRWRAAAP